MKGIIITIILLTVILSGCASMEGLKDKLVPAKGSTECKDFVKSMVPSYITGPVPIDSRVYGMSGKWLDNSKIDIDKDMAFKKGSEVGQNINYYYPAATFEEDQTIEYTKEIISAEGVVLGVNSFKIKFLLDPITGTTKSGPVGSRVMDYRILNYEIVEFHFI